MSFSNQFDTFTSPGVSTCGKHSFARSYRIPSSPRDKKITPFGGNPTNHFSRNALSGQRGEGQESLRPGISVRDWSINQGIGDNSSEAITRNILISVCTILSRNGFSTIDKLKPNMVTDIVQQIKT